MDRDAVRAEESVDLLALDGDSVRSMDGSGRLGEKRKVLRPPTATNGAATAVEEVDLNASSLGQLK